MTNRPFYTIIIVGTTENEPIETLYNRKKQISENRVSTPDLEDFRKEAHEMVDRMVEYFKEVKD